MRGEFLMYATSTAFMQASKLVTALVVAGLLGPEGMGWWNTLQPIIIYGVMLQFGLLNGMGRNMPYFRGQGNEQRERHIGRVGAGAALLSGILAASLVYSASFFVSLDIVKSALRLLALAVFSQQLYGYANVLLIASMRYDLVSLLQFAFGLLVPLLSLPFASRWGLNGYISALTVANVLAAIVALWLAPHNIVPKFDWAETKQLVRIGFPIMIGGALYDLLRTVDRWVILIFLGPVAVGQYTLTILSMQAIILLPSMINAQFYPRMAQRFGATQSYQSVSKLMKQSFWASSALVWSLGVALLLTLRPIVVRWLPDYQGGILAALIVIAVTMVTRPLAVSVTSFLNAVGRANYFMIIQAVTIVVQVVLTILAALGNSGIVGVAIAVAVTQVINTLVLGILAYSLIRREEVEVTL